MTVSGEIVGSEIQVVDDLALSGKSVESFRKH